jgi:hypothetical protein
VDEWRPLPLREAKELASKWMDRLRGYCELVDVTGSVYRESKDPVGDVDLICLARDLEGLRSLGPVKEDDVRIVFQDQGAKVEVWKSRDPGEYELKRWYRRMDRGRFIELASRAKARGMTLSWTRGLIGPDGKIITRRPEEIEAILGSPHPR